MSQDEVARYDLLEFGQTWLQIQYAWDDDGAAIYEVPGVPSTRALD